MHGLGDTRYHHIESVTVWRSDHIYVLLPGADDTLPVIYVLDGGGLLPLFAA